MNWSIWICIGCVVYCFASVAVCTVKEEKCRKVLEAVDRCISELDKLKDQIEEMEKLFDEDSN